MTTGSRVETELGELQPCV